MAIGYIKKKMVEGVETLVPETTAGPSAGTVRKLSFDCNIDYAVPITADETGEGYIGVSGNRKLSFNPKFNIGTVADPEYIGVLKADCFCGKGTNTEIADCVEIGEVCQNLNYKVPFTCNCEVLTACSQNLLFNPNTGLLCSNCMCIANNLEVLCDVCADEYKSRTAGVGITVDTTAEDDTLNHDGDVIYKGCNGELATSSCKDFKYNPSTGTLKVDHVCSCDIADEISNSKLCNTGTSSICYCSSAKAQDYGAVEMHAYCCEVGSNNPLEGCATLGYDGFYLSCVPFCQEETHSSGAFTCAKIGDYCNAFASENGLGGRIFSNFVSSSLTIGEGLVCCSGGYLCSSVLKTECINPSNRVPYRCLSATSIEDSSYNYDGCTHIYQDDYQIDIFARRRNNNGVHCSCLMVNCNAIAGYTCDDSQGINGCFKLDVTDGRFKLCNSCTGGSWANVLTECDGGNTYILKNPSWPNYCLQYTGADALNLYGNTSQLWLNFSGGVSSVKIGSGNGDGCLGSLHTGILCLSDCMAISKSGDTCPSIHIGKWDIAADTLHAYFAGYSTTTGSGYAGGIYLGKLNDSVDGRWGQVQIGYYDAEHPASRYTPRIGFYYADCGICMYDSVRIAAGKVLCTQTICFY